MRWIVFLLVYCVLNVYIAWNATLATDGTGISAAAAWVAVGLLAVAYPIGRLQALGPVGRLLKVIGSYYIAVFEFCLILLPLADAAAWLLRITGNEAAVPAVKWAVIGLLVLALAVGSWNAWSPVVRTYELAVDKPGGPFRELRIAMVSDIHLGNIVGKRHLARLIKHMRAIRPDLILLPGDVLDDVIEPFIRNGMARSMASLQAPLGTFAVLGNHEYYGGHIEEYVQQMNQIGVKVLRDETVLVGDSLYVAGRKDKTAESMDPERRKPIGALLEGLDSAKPIIVMDHQPTQFDRAKQAGADLLLCGHTHRGQFAPNHWVTRRLFELDWGYLRKGAMHVIVSSGFGTWGPPIRLASRSEIVQIILRFA